MVAGILKFIYLLNPLSLFGETCSVETIGKLFHEIGVDLRLPSLMYRLEFDRMRIVPTSLFARLIALCAFFAGQAAQAQAYLESRLTTVKSRARPESDAVGIRSGEFMILPTISVSESYNDNILASESNTRNDLITDVEPAIIVKSDCNRHALKL